MFAIDVYGKKMFVRLHWQEKGYAVGDNTRVDVLDESGALYAHLSVNMPNTPLAPSHFWLKDWSENTELARAILATGHIVIDEDIPPVSSGFVWVRAATF